MYEQICDGVFMVGGGRLSDSSDCLVYLVDTGDAGGEGSASASERSGCSTPLAIHRDRWS